MDRYEAVQLVYCSHPQWPLCPEGLQGYQINQDIIDISILDSSFNPPTLAHLALSRLSRPPTAATTQSHFNAKLLLYSVKNADKAPKSGDATPAQRIEMMILFAKALETLGAEENDLGLQNIAVAVCEEPIFVEKSKILQAFFHSRMEKHLSSPTTSVRLTFLMGIDTLERVLMPKYYGSEEAMQAALETFFKPNDACKAQSYILCARRALGESYRQSDPGFTDKVKDFITSGAVALSDIDEESSSLSSSEVRKNIRLGNTILWKSQVLVTIAQYIEERALYREC